MSRSDRRVDAGLIEERRRNPPLQRVPPALLVPDPPYSGMWRVKRAVVAVVVALVAVAALTCLALAIRGIG